MLGQVFYCRHWGKRASKRGLAVNFTSLRLKSAMVIWTGFGASSSLFVSSRCIEKPESSEPQEGPSRGPFPPHSTGEFPKIGDPNIRPYIIGFNRILIIRTTK